MYYHGTPSKKNVKSILSKGFNEGTWFARHIEDAIEFGGKYVFEVDVKFSSKNWQVLSSNALNKSMIVKVLKIHVDKMH